MMNQIPVVLKSIRQQQVAAMADLFYIYMGINYLKRK